MYRKFFDIEENPFSNTPDPRYIFMSQRHREALAHMGYGAEGDSGFVLLSGEVGTGKTTVCRYLAENLPDHIDLALCINPHVTGIELFDTMCRELGVTVSASIPGLADYTRALNTHLLEQYAKGRRAVLVIDEAQSLSFEVLEQVRMLTNLETTHNKLLQIILIGQPELKEVLAQPHLKQLSQRITARYHLTPMTRNETRGYVAHRVRIGGLRTGTFDRAAVDTIHDRANGIPRLINSIAERCLLGAYAKDVKIVTSSLAVKAADEVLGENQGSNPVKPTPSNWRSTVLASVLGILIAAVVLYTPQGQNLITKVTQSNLAQRVKTEIRGEVAIPTAAALIFQTTGGYVTSQGASLDAISNRWMGVVSADAAINSCLKAKRAGLACVKETGDWDLLRRLNRPAVLALTSPEGARRHISLLALDGDVASWQIAGQPHRTPIQDLSNYWDNTFTVLWQPPQDYERAIQRGMVGDDVVWLRELLDRALASDTSQSAYPAFYDDELLGKVNQFKQSHGLAANGLITPLTILLLDELAGSGNHPTLSGGSIADTGAQ
jgi:general secretion pathway protein A